MTTEEEVVLDPDSEISFQFRWNVALNRFQLVTIKHAMAMNEVDAFAVAGLGDIVADTLNRMDLPHP